MKNIISLVIYATEDLGLSYYDENWNLYAIQVKHPSLIAAFKGGKKYEIILDWLPSNWLIA